MNTLIRLRESMPVFTPAESRVAEYILSLKDDLLGTPISKIATNCNVSKSLVVRLCKKAGYKGYKDLCNAYSASQAAQKYIPEGAYLEMYPGVPESDICKIVMHNTIAAIQGTYTLLDMTHFKRAVDAVLNSHRVLLFGVGGSATVAQDSCYKLQRIGIDAHFAPDLHCQLLQTLTMDEGDCAIAFSYSGNTTDIIEAAQLAKAQDMTVISVTHYGQSPLSDLADIRLHVAASESVIGTGSLTSRLSMLTAMDMLVTCTATRNFDQSVKYLERAARISSLLRQP